MFMLGEALRCYGFWLYDALSGGFVKKYLEDLQKNDGQASGKTSEDLDKLLKHAVSTTAFYQNFRGYSKIQDFPIINKILIKEKYDQFLSSEYKNKKLCKVKTSGSTSERFELSWNSHKRKRVHAEFIYFLEKCGFKLGYRYVYAKVWPKEKIQKILMRYAKNMVMVDCSVLTENFLQEIYNIIKKAAA